MWVIVQLFQVCSPRGTQTPIMGKAQDRSAVEARWGWSEWCKSYPIKHEYPDKSTTPVDGMQLTSDMRPVNGAFSMPLRGCLTGFIWSDDMIAANATHKDNSIVCLLMANVSTDSLSFSYSCWWWYYLSSMLLCPGASRRCMRRPKCMPLLVPLTGCFAGIIWSDVIAMGNEKDGRPIVSQRQPTLVNVNQIPSY